MSPTIVAKPESFREMPKMKQKVEFNETIIIPTFVCYVILIGANMTPRASFARGNLTQYKLIK